MMKRFHVLRILSIAVAVAALAALASCQGASDAGVTAAAPASGYRDAAEEIAEYRAKGLPMMLDFGRGWCKPCKAMAPDLEALHTELAGKVLVRFNDLGKETELAEQYRIRIMPTQVYVDREGKEVYRHEGYASKADMTDQLAKRGFLP
ncbi:MAG: thioredoxin family protein [Deltaproteobacteria bacterium]|nr:thioredoxin family protein [Deltaproteobacteria bacterium]